MQYRSLSIMAALLVLTGCIDDPISSTPAEFEARMEGARTMDLSGTAYASLIYSEAWTEGRYSIQMSAPYGSNGARLLLIQCPDANALHPGTYPLGAEESGCRGIYRVIDSTPSGPEVRDEVISTEGMLNVSALSSETIAGTFQFTGGLRSGFDPVGPVTVTGTFNATRYGS